MPYLVVREPGQASYTLTLHDGLRVGRQQQSNDVVLDDEHVSRTHVRFTRSPQGWSLEDLQSKHGTLVNGATITSRVLVDDDRIQLGNVLLTFRDDEEPEIVHQQPTAVSPPARDRSDQRLQLVYEVSRAIGVLGDREALLGRMLGTILEVLGCERALIGLADAGGPAFRRLARARQAGTEPDDIVISRAVLEAVTSRREAVILHSGGRGTPRTLVREGILEAMAVPLVAGSLLVGFLYVDERRPATRFTPQDLDFLTALGHLTAAALESAERCRRIEALAEALGAAGPTSEIVGASEPMRRLKTQIHKYGAAPVNVLILGESGTGKELIARTLHHVSARSGGAFVAVNCAAIPATMIESELFGYEKGAFTGAVRDKRGKFTLAHGGTLFLDEIGDLDLAAQAKVLRALEEGEIQPLGAERTLHVDVRVVSATNKDLRDEIAKKRFREDLYYRLNDVELAVPPLRARGEDVALLARALLADAAASLGKRDLTLTPAALEALQGYAWPGNVRELRNEMKRAAIEVESSAVDAPDLSPRLLAGERPAPGSPPGPSLAERYAQLATTEQRLVDEAVEEAGGNLSEAARLLGITRVMVKRRRDR